MERFDLSKEEIPEVEPPEMTMTINSVDFHLVDFRGPQDKSNTIFRRSSIFCMILILWTSEVHKMTMAITEKKECY